jgi:gliding motility-associated lipoprotein GldH
MRSSIIILILAAAFISCNHVYKEYDKESFTTLSWRRGQTITFYPEIEDVSKNYNLILGLRHTYGAQIKKMNVLVTMVSPSGQEKNMEYTFDVTDDKGEYLASCAGNICDIETTADEDFKFPETGKYTFILTQNSDLDRVRGIMEFGLIIEQK